MSAHDMTQLRPSWVRKINVARVQDLVPGECWLWTGANSAGYGRVTVNKKPLIIHRYVYELLVGQIPDGLQIDHLCRQPPCINPDHLEPVTPLENTRRGLKGTRTHCERGGHPLSGDNLYVHIGKRGTHRTCRTCRDETVARWRAARKERQAQTWALYLPEQEDAA